MKTKFLMPLLASSFLLLATACTSSDSSEDSTPTNPQPPSAETPVDPGQGGGSAAPVPVMPSSVSDPAITQNLYAAWKAGSYVSAADEAAKYPSLGAEFNEIFGPYINAGRMPGRVIWSTSSNSKCLIDEAQGTPMYKRGCTVSEGIGYGMLITLFQGDMDAYNAIWTYSQGYRNSIYSGGTGLMPWLTNTFHWDVIDGSSATDADLDIAASLVIAYYKTGNQEYLNDALSLINAIWEHEINPANLLIYSGDTPMWHTADPAYNLSYFSPVALRLFAMVDPNHNWTGVLDAMYAYMQKVQAAGTGVFPDWSNTAGVAVNPDNGSADKTYWLFDKESVRIPWRIAWDYYWFKDERALAVLNTLQAFISAKSNGDPAQIPSVNYSWNPTIGADKSGNALPIQWRGAWCLTGMNGSQGWLDACLAIFNQEPMQVTNGSYFSNILQMMFSQLMNGYYVKPF